MSNYNNLFIRVFSSFFSRDFYCFVFDKQKNSGFGVLAVILFVTFFIPSIIIYNKLINFSYSDSDNLLISELKDTLISVPEVSVKEGVLYNNQSGLPKTVELNSFNKNLIVLDETKNSLIASDTMVLFSKDGMYFNPLELVTILLKIFGLKNIPVEHFANAKANFISYPKEPFVFDGEFMIKWSEGYVQSLGNSLLYSLLPSVFIFSLILKFIEVLFLSFIARVVALRYKLQFTHKQIFRLTVVALIPTLVIRLINASFLWSSNLLAMQPLSTLLLVGINLYFIYFAISSVVARQK